MKGQMEMGSFVSLMEHVEYIGKEIMRLPDADVKII